MSLPILLLMLFPLLLAPVQTHRVYSAIHQRMQAHIAVDNAGIALGNNDRDLFNQVRATNQLMDITEIAHHVVHAAAKVPVIGVLLIPEDKAFEAAILTAHAAAYAVAEAKWVKGGVLVMKELHALNTSLKSLSRAVVVPLTSHMCKVCHLQTHWEVEGSPIESGIVGENSAPFPGVTVRMKGKSLLRGSKWSYQMVMHESG